MAFATTAPLAKAAAPTSVPFEQLDLKAAMDMRSLTQNERAELFQSLVSECAYSLLAEQTEAISLLKLLKDQAAAIPFALTEKEVSVVLVSKPSEIINFFKTKKAESVQAEQIPWTAKSSEENYAYSAKLLQEILAKGKLDQEKEKRRFAECKEDPTVIKYFEKVSNAALTFLAQKAPIAKSFFEQMQLHHGDVDPKAIKENLLRVATLDIEIANLNVRVKQILKPDTDFKIDDRKKAEGELKVGGELRFVPLSDLDVPDAKNLRTDILAHYSAIGGTLNRQIVETQRELNALHLKITANKFQSKAAELEINQRYNKLRALLEKLQIKLNKVNKTLADHNEMQMLRDMETVDEAFNYKAANNRAYFLKQILRMVIFEVKNSWEKKTSWVHDIHAQYSKEFQEYIYQNTKENYVTWFQEVLNLFVKEDFTNPNVTDFKAYKIANEGTLSNLSRELQVVEKFLMQMADEVSVNEDIVRHPFSDGVEEGTFALMVKKVEKRKWAKLAIFMHEMTELRKAALLSDTKEIPAPANHPTLTLNSDEKTVVVSTSPKDCVTSPTGESVASPSAGTAENLGSPDSQASGASVAETPTPDSKASTKTASTTTASNSKDCKTVAAQPPDANSSAPKTESSGASVDSGVGVTSSSSFLGGNSLFKEKSGSRRSSLGSVSPRSTSSNESMDADLEEARKINLEELFASANSNSIRG